MRHSPLNAALCFMENKVERFKVRIDGQEHEVTVEPKDIDERVKNQRQQLRSVGHFFKEHPTILLTVISGYISISGLITLWIIFAREKINLFDYASISDFFFGFFAVSLGPSIVAFTIIFLSIATWSYYHKPWKSYWTLVFLYLILAPMVAPLLVYKPYTICSSSFDKYVVSYRVPELTTEKEMHLIASLASYKIFKKQYPGCEVPEKEYVNYPEPHGTEVVAINDGAIALLRIQPNKT